MPDVRVLLLDVGNSAVKLAIGYGASPLENKARIPIYHSGYHAMLKNYLSSIGRPGQILASQVGDVQTLELISDFVDQQFGMDITCVKSSHAACGVRNCYTDPVALGVDRWCAMIAAYHMHGGACCVVDVGSAVTIDGVSSQGVFMGGAILPGWPAWTAALGRSVGLNSEPEQVSGRAGCSTESCISAGFINAVTGAIKRLIQQYSVNETGKPMIFLTGGDAEMIAKYIDLPYRHEPELVLYGLARLGKT